MKPGTRVAYVTSRVAVLGRLGQPLLFDGVRRWSIEWEDGFSSGSQTFPESDLREVLPQ
jgi:hypothetical protein